MSGVAPAIQFKGTLKRAEVDIEDLCDAVIDVINCNYENYKPTGNDIVTGRPKKTPNPKRVQFGDDPVVESTPQICVFVEEADFTNEAEGSEATIPVQVVFYTHRQDNEQNARLHYRVGQTLRNLFKFFRTLKSKAQKNRIFQAIPIRLEFGLQKETQQGPTHSVFAGRVILEALCYETGFRRT